MNSSQYANTVLFHNPLLRTNSKPSGPLTLSNRGSSDPGDRMRTCHVCLSSLLHCVEATKKTAVSNIQLQELHPPIKSWIANQLTVQVFWIWFSMLGVAAKTSNIRILDGSTWLLPPVFGTSGSRESSPVPLGDLHGLTASFHQTKGVFVHSSRSIWRYFRRKK